MGYVYRYISKNTGRWYIGSHNGSNKKYTGSGIIWSRYIKKHGLDEFEREILYTGDDYRNEEEKILIELDAKNDPLSFNLKNEAMGGSFPGPLNGMYGKKLSIEHKFLCGSAFRGQKRPDHAIAITGKNNGNYKHGKRTKEYTTIERKEKDELRKIKDRKYLFLEIQCSYCCLIGSGPNMSRYHFGNCLLNENNSKNILGKFSNIAKNDKRKEILKCKYCDYQGMNIGNLNRWHNENCKQKN